MAELNGEDFFKKSIRARKAAPKYVIPDTLGVKAHHFNIEDSKDCTIRALSNATGKDYTVIRQEMSEIAERQINDGVKGYKFHRVYVKYNPRFVKVWNQSNYRGLVIKDILLEHSDFKLILEEEPITVGSFLKSKPFGSHILIIDGHALAVKNGKIIDDGVSRHREKVRISYSF